MINYMIHVLPGDAVAESFKSSDIEGEIIVCREALIEGDVKSDSLSKFWQKRGDFIGKEYDGDKNSYHENVSKEFEKMLDLANQGREINLWFEYELFCQVNMWFCLSLLANTKTLIYRIAPVVRDKETIWQGFGRLEKGDLKKCFESRTRFSEADILLGKELWNAYQNKDFIKLKTLSQKNSNCFPYLEEVCEAEIEKESRPKKTLSKILTTGESDFGKIFKMFIESEGVYGFGDLQIKKILREI